MISICIPTYEMHGKGIQYLSILLNSILTQSTTKYEVIISDQSDNNEIKDLVELYKTKIDISYHHCGNKGKSSYNLNNAIKHAKYDIIKPMFQDDFFIDTMCLESILNVPNITWGAIKNKRFNENGEFIKNSKSPKYNINVQYGKNTIGCPSVIFFKNDDNYFNNDLVWLMDCEFYERMFKKYENFSRVELLGVGVRLWKNSYTNNISRSIKNKEIRDAKTINL